MKATELLGYKQTNNFFHVFIRFLFLSRYQYLDDTLLEREKANIKLKDELLVYQKWCHELDKGRIPDGLQEMLKEYSQEQKNNIKAE